MTNKKIKLDFVIIGAQKCGTSSLYEYLTQHPQIAKSSNKEVHFFDFNFTRGPDWLYGHFSPSAGQLLGEATPYYIIHPHVPGRVKQLFPDIKIVVLLRNPVDRTYSHYHGRLRNGYETLSFEEALKKENERLEGEFERMEQQSDYHSDTFRNFSYKTRSKYAEQILRWFDVFNPSQFMFVQSEVFFANEVEICCQVAEFLGVDPYSPVIDKVFAKGEYEPMKNDTREMLQQYFEPYNNKLYQLIGVNYNWE